MDNLAVISAQYAVRQTVINLIGAGPSERLCQEDPKRVALILGQKQGYSIYISMLQDDVTATGYQIGSDSSERFYFEKDGPIAQMAWYAQCPGTGGTVVVIECYKVN